ncbi:MAG: DUF2807 domain-containing protein [Fimbriimonadaceae bacterium]
MLGFRVLPLALLPLVAGCGVGEHFGLADPTLPVRADGRKVFAEPPPFHTVEARNGLRVTVIAGGANDIHVAGPDGSARPDLVRWSVSNGVLRIEAASRTPENEVTDVTVVARRLRGLRVYGPGEIHLIARRSPGIAVEMKGSGRIVGSGQVDRLHVRSIGPGTIDLQSLRADQAVVELTGRGRVEVNVSTLLQTYRTGRGTLVVRAVPEEYETLPAAPSKLVSADQDSTGRTSG